MDPFKKTRLSTFDEIEKEFGRMLRNMSAHYMCPYRSQSLIPATDVYETPDKFIVYMEIPGVRLEKLSVLASHSSVTVTGIRQRPAFDHTTCVHQLEVEYGKFERTINFDTPIDMEFTTSTFKDGFLLIQLPKKKISGQIKVTINGE
jgi:HSP20 family protein